ncbi:hypothetical protein FRB95_001599 [Tulasnella sp. JGI-2019a]|nr:hypothetical protein FRB93_007196 [Tulasnella sp. JGI-2019a]KAG9021709.1 hypothetical protein FRB95_001599 [Tulasnella sp. JGI-2019a]
MASAGPPLSHCTLCKKDFESPQGLIDHKKASKHHFYCVRCNLDFTSANELAQHLKKPLPILGDTDAPICVPCSKRFEDIGYLRLHLTTKKHESSCKECIQDFHDAGALQKHQDAVHAVVPPVEETPVPDVIIQGPDTTRPGSSTTRCNLCKKNFESPQGLIDHKKASKYHFFCARCNLDFATDAELAQHREKPLPVRGDIDPFCCVPCSKRFKDLEHLRRHLETTKRHETSCQECVVDFHNASALQKHQDAAHAAVQLVEKTAGPKDVIVQGPNMTGVGPSTNRCTLCKKDFESPRSLAEHKIQSKYHFFCGRCNLDFATSSEHSQHLDKSLPILGDKDAIFCVPCSQPFMDREGLHKHLASKRHETSCIDCMVDFHNMRALQKHQDAMHSAIPPVDEAPVLVAAIIEEPDVAGAGPPTHHCTPCKKDFESPQGLIDHKKVSKHHFYCARCNLDFTSANELAQHLEKPLPILGGIDAPICVPCSKRFKDIEYLRKHLTTKRHESSCKDCIQDFHDAGALQKHRDAVHSVHTVVPLVEEILESEDVIIQERGPDRPLSFPPFFCRKCQTSLQSIEERNHHLETALPLFDDYSTDGAVLCIPCKTTFPTFQIFIAHIDVSNEARTRHRHTCIHCLLDFHNSMAFQRHRWSQEHNIMRERRTELLAAKGSAPPAIVPVATPAPAPAPAPAPIPPSKPILRASRPSSTKPTVSGLSKGQPSTAVPMESTVEPPAPLAAPPSRIPSQASQPSAALLPMRPEKKISKTQRAPVLASTPAPAPAPALALASARGPPTLSPPTSSLPPRGPYSSRAPPEYCHRCHIQFDTVQEFIEHSAKPISLLSKETDGTDRPRCNKCQRPFSSLPAMRLHLTCGLEVHENSCADCLLDFHTANGLQEHKDQVHSTPASLTENCGTLPSGSNPPTDRRPPSPITTSRPIRNNQAATPSIRLADRRANHAGGNGEPNPWGLRQTAPASRAESAGGSVPQTTSSSSVDTRTLHTPVTGRQSTTMPQRGTGYTTASISSNQERANVPNAVAAVSNPVTLSSVLRKARQKTTVPPRSTSPPQEKAITVPCPLCLETATDLTAAPCGHAGCLACLTQSVKIKPECPVCRTPLTLGQLHPLFL